MTSARTLRTLLEPDAEQLALFESNVPERFRLDDATRRRGMRHVAILKAKLEARYPSAPKPTPPDTPSRTPLGERAQGHAA